MHIMNKVEILLLMQADTGTAQERYETRLSGTRQDRSRTSFPNEPDGKRCDGDDGVGVDVSFKIRRVWGNLDRFNKIQNSLG